jgi:MFS family permease
MAAAAFSFVILPQGTPLWPLGLLFGVGYGAYTSVDWALAVDALPSREAAGRDMGVWSIATTLPAILAPLLGGLVISVAGSLGDTTVGYRVVFSLAVVFLLAGAVFILRVRDQFARPALDRETQASRLRLAAGFGTRGGRARLLALLAHLGARLAHAFPVRPIPAAPHQLLLVRFAIYHGKPFTLPGGVEIAKGARICELHLNNAVLSELTANTPPWRLARMLREDLRALARWSHQADFPAGTQALFGYTLLNEAAPRFGFTLRERPHTFVTWLDRFFMTGLLALYHPRGRERLEQGTTYGAYPAELWMSVGELRRRYDPDTPVPDGATR